MRTLQSERRTIGDTVYTISPLATKPALRVLCRILRIAAPAFGDVASLRSAAAAATAALGSFLSGIAGELDDAVLIEVCAAFAEVTEAKPEESKGYALRAGQWEEHFRGRLFDLFQWVAFAAEVTYGPLLKGLQAKAEEPAAPAEE